MLSNNQYTDQLHLVYFRQLRGFTFLPRGAAPSSRWGLVLPCRRKATAALQHAIVPHVAGAHCVAGVAGVAHASGVWSS